MNIIYCNEYSYTNKNKILLFVNAFKSTHIETARLKLLTSTRPIRHQHIAIEAVAFVASVGVHAPVLAGAWLQSTLIEI